MRVVTIALGAACALVLSPAAVGSTKHVQPLVASFGHVSYAPGERAQLIVRTRLRHVELQVLRAGAERAWDAVGKPWGPPRKLSFSRRRLVHRVTMRPGAWDSGLYFVRLTARGGRAVEYAPFVLRPAVYGRNRVAIVLPTYTWQAYNFYDQNRDGRGDSWYADHNRHTVVLGRPYAGTGKPPHYRTNQRGFLRFLVHTGKHADYVADEDLEQFASGDDLAKLYDLVVFSGHEEYVTEHLYDVTERYRDLGGNLAFLSANNFFRRIDRVGNRITRAQPWRELGRPEARLIGVQYRGNDRGGHASPYVVLDADGGAWLFAGLPVANGSTLSPTRYGIEFDTTTADSPPGMRVLADVPTALGGGQIHGEMTYYTTDAGAKVFAAGTLSFGGSDNPVGSVLFENLWRNLTVP